MPMNRSSNMQGSSMRNELTNPVTLTSELPNSTSLLVYPKVTPYTKFEHFGIIDHSFLSYATDKQTDKQTDGLERPTHAGRHSQHE